jgi:hypothetical protein
MSAARKYLDLFLELKDLEKETDTFKVSILPSPNIGETREATTVSYGFKKLEDDLDSLENRAIDANDLFKLGKELADRLLPEGPVRELFKKAIWEAGRDKGVRLRLLIRNPKLAQLPWEYSYLQFHQGEENRSHFLALNPQISIVRHEALPEEHAKLSGTKTDRLRLVAAFASPNGYTKLNLKREKRIIEGIFKDFNVDGIAIDWEPFIEDATIDDLAVALQKGADLFHFAGHGEFREKDANQEGALGEGSIVLLKDKKGKEAHLLSSGDLAMYLQNAGVRVAIFGACNSGRRDGVNAWTGIAPALIEKGIPCVVAMQYEVEDDCAIAFSKMFYSSLAGGLSLDQAVYAGRQAMLGDSSKDNLQWGVPIFYMRSQDGNIFPELSERKSENKTESNKIDIIVTKGEEADILGSEDEAKGGTDLPKRNIEIDVTDVKKVTIVGAKTKTK